jgi:hypothetical protein
MLYHLKVSTFEHDTASSERGLEVLFFNPKWTDYRRAH